MRKETAEGLEVFRKRQEEADRRARGAKEGSPTGEEGGGDDGAEWATAAGGAGRKRKRREQHEGLLKGVKLRRASMASEEVKEERKVGGAGNGEVALPRTEEEEVVSTGEKKISPAALPISRASVKPAAPPQTAQTKPAAASMPKPALVLVDYDSDSDA